LHKIDKSSKCNEEDLDYQGVEGGCKITQMINFQQNLSLEITRNKEKKE